MVVKNKQKLEDLLIKLGLITKKQLELVKVQSAETGKPIEKILREMSSIPEEEFLKVLAITLDMPYVDLAERKIEQKVLNIVPEEIAKKYNVVVFGVTGGFLNVGMLDPNNVQAIDFIEKKTGYRVRPYLASQTSIEKCLDQYEGYSFDMENAIEEMQDSEAKSASEEQAKKDKEEDKNAPRILSQDAPITRAVNTILEYAVKNRASDIHIEPREKEIVVRFRVDGILHNTMTLPKSINAALISRIKILSNLKIDEHRVPQDGRFQIRMEDREVDLRVSITPIVLGEKIVLRLLDKTSGIISLESLGMKGRGFHIIEQGIKKPHGMILSTGPTGSGKSTTLYAVLTKLNVPGVNIITIEDPVEYSIEGINQIQVNTAVGLTFASGLRSILRQDPDIIMVGEIRDAETAELAVQSALTGHTVLSTLHTNSASGALPRLLEMGIEPFLVASTVNTVIGQRLVRKICDKCKEPYQASPNLTKAIKASLKGILPSKSELEQKTKELGFDKLPCMEEESFTLYRGKGCNSCKNTGFLGRLGIFEVFDVNEEMEGLIINRASSSDIQNLAIKDSMVTMRQDGFLKVLAGMTTIEEIIRTTTAD